MGTRHLTIVIQNNDYRVAQYGQWDGYPEGQGLVVLNFLKNCNLDDFKKQIDKCSFIEDENFYKNAYEELDIKPVDGFITSEEADKFKRRYPQLSRDMGASILEFILTNDNVLLKNSIEFSKSAYCEWAYLIDLDNDVLEVYLGGCVSPMKPTDRFFLEKKEKGDCPIQLIMSFDINSLPSENDFVDILKSKEYMEEE